MEAEQRATMPSRCSLERLLITSKATATVGSSNWQAVATKDTSLVK